MTSLQGTLLALTEPITDDTVIELRRPEGSRGEPYYVLEIPPEARAALLPHVNNRDVVEVTGEDLGKEGRFYTPHFRVYSWRLP